MNGLKRALISMAVMIPGLMTVAETAQTLSLDEAVGQALRGNPRLIALGHQRDAMRERPAQAAGLPNPILTYRGMDAADAATFPPTGEKRFEMEQPMPGYGKRDLRKAMAVNAAAGITAEAEAMAREVVLMVKETAFEWQAVRNAHAITRDEEALLSRMAKVTEARYAAGEAAQTDVIKAYMELTLIRQKQIEWEGRDKTLKARLAQLMGRDAGTMPAQIEASMPDGAAPDPAPRIKEALGARAEIRAARLTVERSELQRRLMARESEPDFKVGLEYRSIERGEDMVMF
ncbi:MAG: TolC family protein, partial [bacterium]